MTKKEYLLRFEKLNSKDQQTVKNYKDTWRSLILPSGKEEILIKRVFKEGHFVEWEYDLEGNEILERVTKNGSIDHLMIKEENKWIKITKL